MGWTLFYMLVILKIPVIAAFVLIWYASKPPEDEQGDNRDDGGEGHPGPRPLRPLPSRRGPHPGTPPASPRRIRARARPAEPVAGRHS